MYKDCICPPFYWTTYEAAKMLCPVHGDLMAAQTMIGRHTPINDVQVSKRTPPKLWFPNTHFGECGQSCLCCRALNPGDSFGCCPLPHKIKCRVSGICTHNFIIGIRRTSKSDENNMSDHTQQIFRSATSTTDSLGRNNEKEHTLNLRPQRIRRHFSSPGERMRNKIDIIHHANSTFPVKRKAASRMYEKKHWEGTRMGQVPAKKNNTYERTNRDLHL